MSKPDDGPRTVSGTARLHDESRIESFGPIVVPRDVL